MSTFRGLADDELADPNQIKERNEYDISITEKPGASAKPKDLSEDEPNVETPYLPPDEDNDGGGTCPVPDHEDLQISMINMSMLMYFFLHLTLIRLVRSHIENVMHMVESLAIGMLKLLYTTGNTL